MDTTTASDLLDGLAPGGPPRVFGRHALERAGLGHAEVRELVRTGRLVRLHHGWYALADPARFPVEAYLLRVRAFLAADAERRAAGHVAGGEPILTGAAALVLHGLPLLGTPPAAITVARAYPGGRSGGGLIRPTGPLGADDVVRRDGALVAGPARAALDVARWHTVQAGVAAADAALRAGSVTHDDLDTALARMPRLWRVRNARLARELASPLSESPGESWSAVVLDALGVPAPARQAAFADRGGSIGRVDFWWERHRVAGEFDGRAAYGRADPAVRPGAAMRWAEQLREDRLRGLDVAVVRWTTADLGAPAALRARLAAAGVRR
ncbi:hypothetical protein [Pengzhenrongella sicca]|uniref:Type IV toxin-antitoxin system AbiEi family antitoxin domain-containing protein n=1 Tax=Pengzhenrongella sicca TaxID=2819238 RepID=A0A8A4ZF09_9MICO|nr:hypothetical protein [Pengzhenrongella sicca]QTE30580.1 hypothetical protein J4E96_06305 [Pengzhenrongella sicca]